MLRPTHLLPPKRLLMPRSARRISPASSGPATGRSDSLPGRDLHPLVRCSIVTHERPIAWWGVLQTSLVLVGVGGLVGPIASRAIISTSIHPGNSAPVCSDLAIYDIGESSGLCDCCGCLITERVFRFSLCGGALLAPERVQSFVQKFRPSE